MGVPDAGIGEVSIDLRAGVEQSARAGGVAEMTELVNLGYDAGITPDGPRGPKYVCQNG